MGRAASKGSSSAVWPERNSLDEKGRVTVGGWWWKEGSTEGVSKNLGDYGERAAALVRVRVG